MVHHLAEGMDEEDKHPYLWEYCSGLDKRISEIEDHISTIVKSLEDISEVVQKLIMSL